MRNSQINSNQRRGALISFAMLMAVSLGVSSLSAADRLKADNADNLNLTTAWSGGVAPGAGDVAVWDSTVTGALINLLGTNLSWQGIRVTTPGGAARFDATSTNINLGAGLTIGATGIDLASATQDLTINAPVTIGPDALQRWEVATGRTLTLAARPNKPANAFNNSGVVRFGTNGVIKLGTTATNLLTDAAGNGGNPYATYGLFDWAALDATGTVIPATYSVGFVGGANCDIVTSVASTLGTTYTRSLRFNDPSFVRATLQRNTAGIPGILVTRNSGGGCLTNDGIAAATTFFRAGNGGLGGSSLNVIQDSTNDFSIYAALVPTTSTYGTRLIKSGQGNLVLGISPNWNSGNLLNHTAFNTNTGGLVINEGSVTVNPNVIIGTNSAHTINAGKLVMMVRTNNQASFSVTVNNGGTNTAQVTAANGAMFLTTNLTFAAGTSHLEFRYNPGVPISTTAAPFACTNLTVNGTVIVDVYQGTLTAGTPNPLVKYGALSGSGTLALGFLPPRVNAHLQTNVANSTIDLVVDSVTQPIRWAKGSGTWDLNTSINWVDALTAATTYTQSGAFGDAVQFEDSQSIGNPIAVTLNTSLTPASVTVNAAKNFTISGIGSIGGTGSLTKQGGGTLTLATANAFAAGVNLNGGTVIFSALNNLGAGAISFGGGALQYNGNNDDISVRAVTLGAGGGTINVGASDVTFTKPIGNSGTGGLTKLGSGALKLIGTNLYSGNTVVSNGTLWLSPDGSATRIPNSPAIIVAGGATLDVATMGGLTLSASASQTLRGTGSVNGDITVPSSTTVSPADTNLLGTLTLTSGLIASGGTLVFDVTTTGSDFLSVGGALALNSGTIKILASGLTNGSYKLIGYTGGTSGALANMALNYSQSGKAVSLTDSGAEISLVVDTAAADNLKWAGFGSDWDLVGSLNWLKGASPWSFTNGAVVAFDESGVAFPNVNLAATLSPSSVTISNTTDYTFSGSGKISGAAGLNKNGTGTLTVLTFNDNFGATTISKGKIQVGNGGTSGDLGTGNITNNAALVFQQPDSRTVSGVISGSGSLAQQGTALLSLGADSAYTGPTTIASGGLLSFGAGSAGGVVTATSVITNDGTLVLNNTANWNLIAPVTGAGKLIKSNSNTVILSGMNTYSNGTTVAGGLLKPASASAWPGGNLTVSGGTFDVNGLDLIVNALAGPANSQRVVNNTGSATNLLTVGNSDATGAYSGIIADNDGTGGKLRVLKIGTGTQTLGGINNYSGGTVVSNGILRVGDSGLGAAPVTLSGGTLDLTGATMGNNINVAADSTLAARIGTTANINVSGAITGTNRLTLLMDQIEVLTVASLSGFTGTFDFTNSVGLLRLSSGIGSSSAVFDLGLASAKLTSLGGINDLGALKGSSGTFLETYSSPCSFRIGALGQDTTFDGTIRNAQIAPFGKPGIIKVGAGTLTLTGDNSLSTGDFTVQGGTLLLSGSASTVNATNITINAGAALDIAGIGGTLARNTDFTLTGAGTLRGSLDLSGGGTLRPGDTIGNLIVTNTATLGGAVFMQLNRTNSPATNDMLTAVSIVAGGDLTVTNLGPVLHTGDKFKLFSLPVSGSFASVTLPVSGLDPNTNLVTYTWANNLAVDGTIEVLAGYLASPSVNTNPTNLTFVFSGGNLTLSWPADYIGWQLQTQTNNLNVGLSTNWSTVAGSATTNSVMLPVSPANPTMFFRMVYP